MQQMGNRLRPRNTDLAIRYNEDMGGAYSGLAYLVCVIDCCTREIVGCTVSDELQFSARQIVAAKCSL
jgi:hypothetical protein